MKFFNKKTLLFAVAVVGIAALSAFTGMLVYVSSPGFKETARQYLVREIEIRTGGHATLGRLTWNLFRQRVSVFDLTIHGTEPPDSAALAHVESMEIGVNFRSLLQRKLNLFELTVTRPEFHVLVDAKGNTNLPSPPARTSNPTTDYQVSIANFSIAHGSAFVNEQQIHIDFALRNLESSLSYQGVTRVLTASTSFDGVLDRQELRSIPYRFSADTDFTRGTLLAKHIVVTSGDSRIQLQGRINDILTRDVAGTLEYSGTAEVPFMNYFFPNEKISGNAQLAGAMDFSNGHFNTHGGAKIASIGYNEWNANGFRGDYEYHYPAKRMTLEHVTASVFGGTTEGSIHIDGLPGDSRISLELAYKDVDGAAMARMYPWDPKYRIDSRMTGQLKGWFEGRFERFDFEGDAALRAAAPALRAGTVSLPLDGTLEYTIQPGQANIHNANLHFLSTSIQADGSVKAHDFNMRAHMQSSDLGDLSFLYAGANGTGSFDGTLTGPTETPIADGTFVLRGYKYQKWNIQEATGTARMNTRTNTANLTNVHVVQGQSQVTLDGSTTFDASRIDLRIQTAQLRAEDAAPFFDQKLFGTLSGAIHLTSITPLRFDGDVRAAGLVLRGQAFNDVQSHVQYDAPTIALQNLSVADNGSTLTGRATYNTTTEAMGFTVRINTIDLKRLRPFGMPEDLEGIIQQADLTGLGTPAHPEVSGTASLRNLSFHGETFPQARVGITTTRPKVTVTISGTRDLDLTAEIDTEDVRNGYPFTAKAGFKKYPIERIAGFTRGSLVVTGDATLKGALKDLAHVSGNGTIEKVELGIQAKPLESMKPFAFDFNSERLNLSDVSLVGVKGTQLNMRGTVGLTPDAKLALTLNGQADAGLLASDDVWTIGGVVTIKGQVGGTVSKPDLQGQASFSDLSISRKGVAQSLTALKGDVVFDQHRMTLNNVDGRYSGGTVHFQGTGTIDGGTIGTLNIRVEPKDVRIRMAGLRSNVLGSLLVSGTMDAPSVSGDIQIQSLALNGSFEEFLALFETTQAVAAPSPFGAVRLSLHVTGNRNITVHNELATAEARVDLEIKGTMDKPVLTGHVETNNGTLVFNGRKYDVTRGNIDFVDPIHIDPSINIQAETTVRNYQVFLSISGRADRLQLGMRSEPSLSQLEIVNLISGAKTSDELAQSTSAGTLPTGERVFQGGAASILSDMLLSRVGSKFNLMGLDRMVRIDPLVVGASNTTTARITLSQQLTKDLSVTYSQDLSSNKQQIIQIEYFITKNISVLASKDENDVRALDLRIRKRF